MTKPKVSYYLSHPIQYFSPLLRQMAAVFDLHVYYFSDASIKGALDKGFGRSVKWDIPLLDGYSYSFLKNISWRKSTTNSLLDLINPGVVTSMVKDPAKVVIVNGWSYFSTLLTIVTARLTGKQVWLRAENPLTLEMSKSKKLLLIKKILLKWMLFPMVDRFLYIGDDSKRFFLFYGVAEKKLVYTPYAVDNDFFSRAFAENKQNRSSLCDELGLPKDKKIILFTAKYIPRKRPFDLIKAFELLDMPDVALVLVGDGELRTEMEEYIRTHDIKNVFLTGFVNQGSISKYYSVADVFVLCSESDTWGLSVNEAMNFELPVITSHRVCCSGSLIVNGENGFVFTMGDVKALSECLRSVLVSDEFRKQAGRRSAEIIKDFNYSVTVKSLEEAI